MFQSLFYGSFRISAYSMVLICLIFSFGGLRFAYVRQEDLFFSQLTVRETLSLAAELQLPDISSAEARLEYVNSLLFKLGLVRLANGIDEVQCCFIY